MDVNKENVMPIHIRHNDGISNEVTGCWKWFCIILTVVIITLGLSNLSAYATTDDYFLIIERFQERCALMEQSETGRKRCFTENYNAARRIVELIDLYNEDPTWSAAMQECPSGDEDPKYMVGVLQCVSAIPTPIGHTNVTPRDPKPSANTSAYNTDEYCQQIGKAAGGSYQIEAACHQQEREAEVEIRSRTVAPEIERYCEKIGMAAGGSYQIMRACIDQEEAAKKSLGK
jgi:hypothetical protein